MEQSSSQAVKLQQLHCGFHGITHCGSPQEELGRVGELLDSSMPSCFLILWTSGVLLSLRGQRGSREAELSRHKDSPALGIVGSEAAWQEHPQSL